MDRKTSLSEVLSMDRSKYTPGLRTSWLTTTRSVPLMMKVPLLVIMGKSPMKTSWPLNSPVTLLWNSASTNKGAEKVMSFSLHSSSECLISLNWWVPKKSWNCSVKSSMGEISSRTSLIPSFSSQSKDVRWTPTRSGRGRTSSSLAKLTRSRPGTSVASGKKIPP